MRDDSQYFLPKFYVGFNLDSCRNQQSDGVRRKLLNG